MIMVSLFWIHCSTCARRQPKTDTHCSLLERSTCHSHLLRVLLEVHELAHLLDVHALLLGNVFQVELLLVQRLEQRLDAHRRVLVRVRQEVDARVRKHLLQVLAAVEHHLHRVLHVLHQLGMLVERALGHLLALQDLQPLHLRRPLVEREEKLKKHGSSCKQEDRICDVELRGFDADTLTSSASRSNMRSCKHKSSLSRRVSHKSSSDATPD